MSQKSKKDYYVSAKKNLAKLKVFYWHLSLYATVVFFIVWNLLIIEDSKYTQAILALNYSILFVWSIAILLHYLYVFKMSKIFGKNWEQRKLHHFNKNASGDHNFYE